MKQKWSKEKIVESIKELKVQNVDISASNISKNHIPLFTAACSRRYFSSWSNAVKAAGIDYDQILEAGKARRRKKLTKWSKEQVLEAVRQAESKNLLTTYRDRLALYSAARREFGSWKQALEAAGYRLTKGSHKNSNQIFKKEDIENPSRSSQAVNTTGQA
ncbi:MAG TPA: hypothetical protein VMV05_10155 [bacterium]|nr:hypothetical protein [bacterium]